MYTSTIDKCLSLINNQYITIDFYTSTITISHYCYILVYAKLSVIDTYSIAIVALLRILKRSAMHCGLV